jgi:hypothetical protein
MLQLPQWRCDRPWNVWLRLGQFATKIFQTQTSVVLSCGVCRVTSKYVTCTRTRRRCSVDLRLETSKYPTPPSLPAVFILRRSQWFLCHVDNHRNEHCCLVERSSIWSNDVMEVHDICTPVTTWYLHSSNTYGRWNRCFLQTFLKLYLIFPSEIIICINACYETNFMLYLSSVYSVTMPLHVSDLLVAHHQEVAMYIWENRYVL